MAGKPAQWNMAFSGEAPDTPEAQAAFKQWFEEIVRAGRKFDINSANHQNDNASWYSYLSGTVDATNYHETNVS